MTIRADTNAQSGRKQWRRVKDIMPGSSNSSRHKSWRRDAITRDKM